MERSECNEIFLKLIPQTIKGHKKIAQNLADIHTAVASHFSSQNPNSRDLSRGEAAMTLRNFHAALTLIESSKIHPRDACSIAYLAQLPASERTHFSQ
jgi:hypothetical protein